MGSRFGGGAIDTDAVGIGATATWYGNTGFYADAQAQVTWYRSELKSAVLGTLVDDHRGSGEAFSYEVGKRVSLGGGLSLTPQFQLAYSNVRFDDFVDPAGAAVAFEIGDSLKSRSGTVGRPSRGMGRRGRRAAEAPLWHRQFELRVVRRHIDRCLRHATARRNNPLWAEFGFGGSYSWNDGRYTVFSEASADTAVSKFGDSNTLKINAGFRMKL